MGRLVSLLSDMFSVLTKLSNIHHRDNEKKRNTHMDFTEDYSNNGIKLAIMYVM